MLKLNLDKNNTVKFSVAIEGANFKNISSRLTFINESHLVSFNGKMDADKVSFNLNNLEKFFEGGTVNYMLEVFTENDYFKVIEDRMELIKPVSVKASLEEAVSIEDKSTNLKISAKMTSITENSNDISDAEFVDSNIVKKKKRSEFF